ncbi:2-methylpropanoate--CoA ligase CCL4 [Beta vulgaris subsp. vulgaris]|uniref:2-methylpropanoate--CoA ligase CCL4 n=1 Tax=Beta vulgaris subsp. vulgaris TaxID=3555 RepID=UPI0020369C27|nr:2-methylpropanoate--CoA ligase CCL4 [Beta vulgaris subsp. vulgaris]
MDQLKPKPANSMPLTPLTLLERAAIVYGECPSIVYKAITYTWADTHRRCLQIASSLTSLGIVRGDVVSVVAPNVPAAYELHFAAPMSGAVLNNINIRLDPRTISILLRHSESKLVFVYYRLSSLVLQAISLLPADYPRPILVLITDNEYDYDHITPSEFLKALAPPELALADNNTKPSDEFLTTYEEMVESGDPGYRWIRPECEWDPIVLNYTSGTTSSPKGVVHCHRGSYITTMDALTDWSVPKQPVYLWTLPMFHSNGWSFTWGMAAVGGTNVCLKKFDGATIHAAIRAHNVTHMCAAPVVLSMLTTLTSDPGPLSWPVHILTGGSPPPAPILIRAEALGFIVGHGYGLTETGGVMVSCAWKRQWNDLPSLERARLRARQGVRTIALTDINIINPNTGQPVNRDGKSVGEIVLRGASIMLGYLKDPEGTSKCMGEDGWFRTGDLGVMHSDGYLEIKDRSKDIIISGGENISSVEVENVLYTYPAVSEVAVVAKNDEYWGETPCAFISLRKGLKEKPTERDIFEYCRAKMPHYMVPKRVVFKEDLPKTSTGKIQKYLLRDMANSLGMDKNRRVTSSFPSRL